MAVAVRNCSCFTNCQDWSWIFLGGLPWINVLQISCGLPIVVSRSKKKCKLQLIFFLKALRSRELCKSLGVYVDRTQRLNTDKTVQVVSERGTLTVTPHVCAHAPTHACVSTRWKWWVETLCSHDRLLHHLDLRTVQLVRSPHDVYVWMFQPELYIFHIGLQAAARKPCRYVTRASRVSRSRSLRTNENGHITRPGQSCYRHSVYLCAGWSSHQGKWSSLYGLNLMQSSCLRTNAISYFFAGFLWPATYNLCVTTSCATYKSIDCGWNSKCLISSWTIKFRTDVKVDICRVHLPFDLN